MIKATFTIDGCVFVDGIHDPQEKWNGWACPLFPIDSVRIIAEWVDSLGVQGAEDFGGEVPFVDDAGRVFWVNGDEARQVLPVDVDGAEYFDMWNGWIWSTVES
jgi:hypothetical protein